MFVCFFFCLHAEGAEISGHTRSAEPAELKSWARLTCRFCFCRYCRWHCVNSRFCGVEKEDVPVTLPSRSLERLAERNDLNNEKLR